MGEVYAAEIRGIGSGESAFCISIVSSEGGIESVDLVGLRYHVVVDLGRYMVVYVCTCARAPHVSLSLSLSLFFLALGLGPTNERTSERTN